MIVIFQGEAVRATKLLLLATIYYAAITFFQPVEVLADAKSGAVEFSEKQVAGSASDFMIVRHLRLKGSNREIGKKLAEIARDRHKAQADPIDPVVLRARHDFYRRNYPTHFARAQGAADAFNLTLDTTNLDVTALYINMNPSPACSTVYYPPGATESGHATLSRNYDFSTGTVADIFGMPSSAALRPMTGDVYIVEVYPDEGYPSLYVTPYDLLGGAMDGINAKGLTVALLADDMSANQAEPSQTAQAGLSEVEIPRFLLDTCATVEDAKAALMSAKQYYSFIPCHYIIGDRSGKSFIWEYSGSHNREYITDGGGKPQIITNHPVHKYAKLEDMPTENSPGSSYMRMRRLHEEISKAAGKASVDTMKNTNLCVAIPATPRSGNPRPPGRTLWHALYDCTENSMSVDFYLADDPNAPRGQKRSGYLAFKLDGK